MNYCIRITVTIAFLMVGHFFIFANDEQISEEQKEAIAKVLEGINKTPDFTLPSISGDEYNLRKLEGNVVLINFWATWCGPCRMEIPDFNELYEKYHEYGFQVLGISVSDTKKQLENFLKSYEIKYPILYGSSKVMNKVTSDYGGVYSLPTSFLIDKNGEVIRTYPGAILKSYDPQLYFGLIYEIEKSIDYEKNKQK